MGSSQEAKDQDSIRHYRGSVSQFKQMFDDLAGENTNAYDTPEYQGFDGVHPVRGAKKSPHWDETNENHIPPFENFSIINEDKEDLVEGNAFLGARAKAIEEDLEEFEFNGKIYPVIKSKKIIKNWEHTNEGGPKPRKPGEWAKEYSHLESKDIYKKGDHVVYVRDKGGPYESGQTDVGIIKKTKRGLYVGMNAYTLTDGGEITQSEILGLSES